MPSAHTLGFLRTASKLSVGLSRGYVASAVSPTATAARAPARTYVRKTAVPVSSVKAKVVQPDPVETSAQGVDDFPLPVAEALPDYHKISPPLSSLPTADSGYKSLPGPPASSSISGEALVGDSAGVSDWSTSFKGLSERPFSKETADLLLAPLKAQDVEIKPDGLLYLPEIKYRRVLNAAFGPGGWGMAPRGETSVGPRLVSREWGLICLGRLVSIARGEQEYFDPSGIPTATEACKSNALMRCCKDLGIASELWDPTFIRAFKAKHCHEAFVEHQGTKKKRKLWRKKDAKFEYPYKEV